MLRLSRDQALEVLTPHAERLYRIGAVPWERWQSEYPNQVLHTPRTRANVLYDLMVNQARTEFRGIRGTEIVDPPNGVVLLDIDQRVLIRFKKLDDESLPRNYPTDAAKDWDIGEDLPGIPSSPQRLTLGYRLNRLQLRFEMSWCRTRWRADSSTTSFLMNRMKALLSCLIVIRAHDHQPIEFREGCVSVDQRSNRRFEMREFNPEMLILARESRGHTQLELAFRLGIDKVRSQKSRAVRFQFRISL